MLVFGLSCRITYNNNNNNNNNNNEKKKKKKKKKKNENKNNEKIEKYQDLNPTAEWALRALIDFTLSNARRFYSSKGNPLNGKGLREKLEDYGGSGIWK